LMVFFPCFRFLSRVFGASGAERRERVMVYSFFCMA
jgi:hypothetical protein